MELLDLPPAHLAVVEAERVSPFRGIVQIGVARRRRSLHNGPGIDTAALPPATSRLRRERRVRVGLLPVPQRHAGQCRRYRHKPTHANRLAGGGGQIGRVGRVGRRLAAIGVWGGDLGDSGVGGE